jgi:Rrf2 family protein
LEIIKRNTDYAIRALVYLASNPQANVSAGDIAENTDVPFNFLQKILQKMVNSGLVKSHRGAQGGFSLAKDPREINLLEILENIQGKLDVNKCFLEKDPCPQAPKCQLKYRWHDIELKIVELISAVTLQDLVDDTKKHRKNSNI